MRGGTGGSQWAPLPCVPNTHCGVDCTHKHLPWYLSSSDAEDTWSGPLCLQVDRASNTATVDYGSSPQPRQNRTNYCDQITAGAKCRLGGSSNSVWAAPWVHWGEPLTRCFLRGSTKEKAWGKAGLSTHLSQQMWPHPLRCPSPPPGLLHQCLLTPQTRTHTGCFQGKERKKEEIMAMAF